MKIWTTLTLMLALTADVGCVGTTDLCAEAAEHVQSCAGIDLQVPETCDPFKANALLGIPCERMGQSRRSFSAWGGVEAVEDSLNSWFSDPEPDELLMNSWKNSDEEWDVAGGGFDYDYMMKRCYEWWDGGYNEGRADGMAKGVAAGFGLGALVSTAIGMCVLL